MVKQMGLFILSVSLGLGIIFLSLPVLDYGLSAQASPGKLNKVHEKYQGTSNCIKCHSAPGETSPAKCLACHNALEQRITAKKGFHRDKSESCSDCHTEHAGRDSQLNPLDKNDFDHEEAGFRLEGAHLQVGKCEICHTSANSPSRQYSKSYLLKDGRCQACHQDPHRGGQPNCIECHSTRDWGVDIW